MKEIPNNTTEIHKGFVMTTEGKECYLYTRGHENKKVFVPEGTLLKRPERYRELTGPVYSRYEVLVPGIWRKKRASGETELVKKGMEITQPAIPEQRQTDKMTEAMAPSSASRN